MTLNKTHADALLTAAKATPRARTPFSKRNRQSLSETIARVHDAIAQLPTELNELVRQCDGAGLLASADAALDDDEYGISLAEIQTDARDGLADIIRTLTATQIESRPAAPKQNVDEYLVMNAKRMVELTEAEIKRTTNPRDIEVLKERLAEQRANLARHEANV